MKKQLQIWNLVSKSLQQNIPVMLLYVLQSDGSSPGRQGFFMAVNGVGKVEGSIGGGIMEHKFIEMSKEKLKQPDYDYSVHVQYHDKSAAKNQSGMICSGEQTILVYRVRQKDSIHVQDIIACMEQYNNGLLQLSQEGLHFSATPVPDNDYFFSWQSDEEWLYTEKAGFKNNLFIVGGGHCALALSRIMCEMDFYIHLLDNRSDLYTWEQNVYVHKKTILDDYSELKDLIPSGDHQYVVIMTMGYRSDDIAVRILLDKKFNYFGMLGSKTKMEKMFADFRASGISEEQLLNIHSPIGIQIKSETPEEIAVSIAAQIIQVKNH